MNKDKTIILEEISKLSRECGSVIDAVVEICERYDIEIETMARYIKSSKEYKEKVRVEGVQLKMILDESI